MHTLTYEINCTDCGCPDVEVQRRPRPGEWFASGVGQCNECGHVFSFRAPEKGQEADETAKAVVYRPVKCPSCGSTDTPVQRSMLPVRYHKCRACGETFKSVESR